MNLEQAADALSQLGNITRLKAFRLLVRAGDEGMAVGELQKHLDIPASTLSHHLSHLKWAGLVEQRRHGRTLYCHAQFKAMDELVEFLSAECCQGVSSLSQEEQAE